VQKGWAQGVQTLKDVLLRGKEAKDQINILGDDGVPLEYHTTYNKAEVVDFGILQQNSFDDTDGTTPMVRQKHLANTILEICQSSYNFEDFDDVGKFFKRVRALINDMKYTKFESQEFFTAEKDLKDFVATKKIVADEKVSA
jgi:V/A-type H+-transporting ATPase subunit A